MGIEALKNLIKAASAIGKAVMSAKADGKIDLMDLPLLIGVFPTLGPVAASYNDVIPELKDLSNEEAAELIAMAMTELSLDDPRAKALVEKSLKAAAALYDLYKTYASA